MSNAKYGIAVVRPQWKGTDICADIDCYCGECLHLDGAFAYYIKCPVCERCYRMPTAFIAHEDDSADGFEPVLCDRPIC